MPYVQRDPEGLVSGVFARPQIGYAEEWLDEAEVESPTELLRSELLASLKLECRARIERHYPITTQLTMTTNSLDLSDLNACVAAHDLVYRAHKNAIKGSSRSALLGYDVRQGWPDSWNGDSRIGVFDAAPVFRPEPALAAASTVQQQVLMALRQEARDLVRDQYESRVTQLIGDADARNDLSKVDNDDPEKPAKLAWLDRMAQVRASKVSEIDAMSDAEVATYKARSLDLYGWPMPEQRPEPMGYGIGAYGGGPFNKLADIPEGFSRTLSAAPEGETLRVFKRTGEEDTGYREGDRWFVYEGGDRAWEIAPSGVVAWAAREPALEGCSNILGQ